MVRSFVVVIPTLNEEENIEKTLYYVRNQQTKASFLDYYSDKIPYIVSGNGMAGISGPPLSITQHGNIFIVGDSATDTACGHPPMAPRVTTCAAMMAQAIFELTLNDQSVS